MPVVADDYLDPETLVRIGSFELRAKIIVEGLRSGMHESPYRGFSIEFAEHRQYVQGDDLRHLDWKVFGRSDKLYLKQYEQETNLDLVILVDSSGSMGYGTFAPRALPGADNGKQRWTKFDHATAIAAALSYLALRQQDRVGMVVFADGIRSLVNRSSASGHWRQLVSALNTQPVQASTSVARCIDQTLGKLNNKVLMLVLSDLFDDPDLIGSALARVRHRGHDLILMQILDRQEMRFDFRAPAPFIGLEDEGRLNLDPRALRQAYLDAIQRHSRLVEQSARGFGYDYQRLDSHEPIGPALSYFLARRMSRMKRSRQR